MKVYELMDELAKMPAGADVNIGGPYRPKLEDRKYYAISSVEGGDSVDEVVSIYTGEPE